MARAGQTGLTTLEARQIVAAWQERLNLSHWHIDVEFGEDGLPDWVAGDAVAWMSLPDDYNHGTLGLAKGWQTETRRTINEHVVHELLHALMRDWSRTSQQMNRQNWIGKEAWTILSDRLTHEEEQAVEHLAQVLVNLGGIV